MALCSLAGGLLRAALPRRAAALLVQAAAAAFLAGSVLLAASRSAALVIHYGAPMRLYSHLPQVLLAAGCRLASSPGPALARLPLCLEQALPCLPAPAIRIQRPTQVADAGGPSVPVCVGAEWHRFPSSFLLPDPYRLQVGGWGQVVRQRRLPPAD